MKELIDHHWLTTRTGDPFADVGGLVIDFFLHYPPVKNKSILDLIGYAADIYIDNWDAKLHPFFLNSTITQAQFVGDRKRQETMDYFSHLLDEDIPCRKGYCEITGRKTILFPAGRNNQILGGSGTFVNFHSNLQPGTYLSKEVLIRMFFVPLGVCRLADKIALITSNNEKVQQFFVFKNCVDNMEGLKNATSKGPLKSIFRNPANALFRFIDDYLKHLEAGLNTDEKQDFDSSLTSVELYHFSNLGQKPEIALYSLDSDVFRFYTNCQASYKTDWQLFIQRHYSPDNYSKSVFNEEEKKWETKEGEEITFEEYQRWRNFVLNGLFNKHSLSKIFLKWSQYNPLPMGIINSYQIQIRGMKKGTIEKIDAISTFIVQQELPFAEDVIKDLNSTISRAELRKIFLKIQELAYQQRAKEAIISASDYLEYLLPASSPWTELRDLFVISIYQNRHVTENH